MKKDLVDFLLSHFRERPGMYLTEYSISKLSIFVSGFMIASWYYDESNTSMKRFDNFLDWFQKRHSLQFGSTWTLRFLEKVNNDESAALEFFLSELEIFINDENH